MSEEPGANSGSVLVGIGLTALLHFGFAVVWLLAVVLIHNEPLDSGLAPLMGIGVVQLVYMVPAVIFALSVKRHNTMVGLLLGGAISFLLNAACFGVLLLGFSGSWGAGG